MKRKKKTKARGPIPETIQIRRTLYKRVRVARHHREMVEGDLLDLQYWFDLGYAVPLHDRFKDPGLLYNRKKGISALVDPRLMFG